MTEYTGTTAKGTFSARCFGNVDIAGTAQGTLAGVNVTWSAAATGTIAGAPPCAITLSGIATLETDRIRIPYSGTTCLGPVSGTEVTSQSQTSNVTEASLASDLQSASALDAP